MELLAIVILGISALASFSTADNKPKTKDNQPSNNDADLPFTEACDMEGGNGKK
jgi:hypothetical protein